MRPPQARPTYATLYYIFLFHGLIAAGSLECSKIVTDGKTWDLSKLGGRRSVMKIHETPPSIHNITFTIDICKDLEPDGSAKKEDECPSNTRVCGIEHTIKLSDSSDEITKVIPIAGDLRDYGGSDLDAKVARLGTSDSPSDSEKEGLRIELNGGKYEDRKQMAIVEFICDPDWTGLETVLMLEDNHEAGGEKRALSSRSDNSTASLRYISYDHDIPGSDTEVLRLKWYTKYACESQNDGGAQRSHWGFFTWFLIIAFLAIASYLIFGSWLNYNMYGARGWDLLPHADTIRDVPYLLKDWTKRVVNTVSGSGYRGGYSAV